MACRKYCPGMLKDSLVLLKKQRVLDGVGSWSLKYVDSGSIKGKVDIKSANSRDIAEVQDMNLVANILVRRSSIINYKDLLEYKPRGSTNKYYLRVNGITYGDNHLYKTLISDVNTVEPEVEE